MPKSARDPDAPVFDFQLNPEKPDLAASSVAIYRGYLNKIAEVSYQQSLQDKRKKPILNKKDLLAKSGRVIDIINNLGGDSRPRKCAMFSAVFYAIGRKDLKKNKNMLKITEAFRAIYNDKNYQDYKDKKAEADEAAGQED